MITKTNDCKELLEKLEADLEVICDRHPPTPMTLELRRALCRLNMRRLEAARTHAMMHEGLALHRAFGGQGRAPVTA